MNFRFSHAIYEKAPTSQRRQRGAFAPHWRQRGAFAPHWRQGKEVHLLSKQF